MTVCVVAEFPWLAVKSLAGSQPPAAIVCTDTRVVLKGKEIAVRADNNEPYWIGKQRTFGDNLIVCYTSANIDVTTAALDRIKSGADVKSLGRSLFRFHRQYGGFTELLTVVWPHDADKPQILEVMPPLYEPRPRSGIVGIGNPQVLERFTSELDETPSSLVWPIPTEAEVIELLERRFRPRDTLASIQTHRRNWSSECSARQCNRAGRHSRCRTAIGSEGTSEDWSCIRLAAGCKCPYNFTVN
jgi:hypothetical protein